MSADKKNNKEKLPEPEKKDMHTRNQEDSRSREIKQRKSKKVNYIIKDLPIY
jgi:hypothetical protein